MILDKSEALVIRTRRKCAQCKRKHTDACGAAGNGPLADARDVRAGGNLRARVGGDGPLVAALTVDIHRRTDRRLSRHCVRVGTDDCGCAAAHYSLVRYMSTSSLMSTYKYSKLCNTYTMITRGILYSYLCDELIMALNYLHLIIQCIMIYYNYM